MAGNTPYTELKSFLVAQFAPMKVIDFDQIEPELQQSEGGETSFLVVDDSTGAAREQMLAFGFADALCMRETSSIQIYAYVSAPESSTQARQLCDSVRDLLRYRRFLGGAVRVDEITPPEFDSANEGLWTIGVISVGLDYDFSHMIVI